MRNWSGLVLFSLGVWFLYAGRSRRLRVLTKQRPNVVRETTVTARHFPAPLGTMAALRPIIVAVLAFAGLKSILAYVWFDAGRFFSSFDLAGFIFFLAAYGTWITLVTLYRASASTVPDMKAQRASSRARRRPQSVIDLESNRAP